MKKFKPVLMMHLISTKYNVQLPCLVMLIAAGLEVNCLTHERTLMWTLKSTFDGSVDVRGVPGDPEYWVFNGITEVSNSYFTDPVSRQTSRRLALAFQYSTRRVFFSDKGYKEIFRIILQPAPRVNQTYRFDVKIEVVYGGISTQVNGMAMDWASGSLYWTDALYNWITVANASDYNMAKQIIHTGFSRPMGLAVYPKKGLLFWSVVGAVPKIERSTLSGQSRINFVDFDIERPLGLSVDYRYDRLYWVDDLRDTVERVDLDNPATSRWSIHVGYRHSLTAKLFGLAVYNDFIFVTDQVSMTIDIFNKSTGFYISNFSANVDDDFPKGIPYDIQMYDSSLQEEIDSDCKRLNCSDICISDGGQNAHCICQEGFSLSADDHRTCVENATFRMPQYLYSVGDNLCGSDIIAADQQHVSTDIKCFFNLSGHEIVALGFNSYTGFIFFSDMTDRVIHRIILTNYVDSATIEVISANAGRVTGLAVDWIADNLYWTDEERGVLMVSRLTGRYPKVLLQKLNRPQSVAVNPLNGTLYWATPDTISMANMDGSNAKVLIQLNGSNFDGMVLDIRRNLLYWVDQSLPGIRSCHMNGSNLAVVLQADITAERRTFHDVTVYQNYIAWTNGMNSVYFGVKDDDNSSLVNVLGGIQHADKKTSHDIITYDTYLQPPLDQGKMNPCDVDNDVIGCSQLCLLKPTGRQCACSFGFTLVNDNQCTSEPLMDNFLLFIDPYHKNIYQYDIGSSSSAEKDRLRGIALQSANIPSLAAFDPRSKELYWFDEDRLKNSIKKISILETAHYHVVSTLDKDARVQRIDAVNQPGCLLFTNSISGSAFLLSSASINGDFRRLTSINNVHGSAITVDDCSGDVYWVESSTMNIMKCNLADSCFSDFAAATVFNDFWSEGKILGLNMVRDKEMNLIAWTAQEVYSIVPGNSTLLFAVNDSFSLTGVVMIKKTVYFVSAFHNAVFQYDTEVKSVTVTVEGFSRVSDLKIYHSKCNVTSSPTVTELETGAKVGIALGAFFFLLLLILLIVCLAILCRRWREKQTTLVTVAYTNPTYDRLNSLVSTLSHLSDGAEGINPYDNLNNNIKGDENKDSPFPPAYDDLFFANEVEGAAGIGHEAYYYSKEAPECEKKGELPFPEINVVEVPIFKIEGVKPESAEPRLDSNLNSETSEGKTNENEEDFNTRI